MAPSEQYTSLSVMGDKKCGTGKIIKSVLLGLAAVAVIIGVTYYFNPKTSDTTYFRDHLPDLNMMANFINATMTEVSTSHPKDVRVKISKADVDELIQSVETYKESLPDNIVSTINRLISEHQSG